MNWKGKGWKVAALVIFVPLMLSVGSEIAATGGLIHTLGLEILILLFEV